MSKLYLHWSHVMHTWLTFWTHCVPISFSVSGDANFEMRRTGLTFGSFVQPSIARNLLEQHASVEKGLCQRILWCAPKPTMAPFEELEKVDSQFTASVGKHRQCMLYELFTAWLNSALTVEYWHSQFVLFEVTFYYYHLLNSPHQTRGLVSHTLITHRW